MKLRKRPLVWIGGRAVGRGVVAVGAVALIAFASLGFGASASAATDPVTITTNLPSDGFTFVGSGAIVTTVTIPLDSGLVVGDTVTVSLPTNGSTDLALTTTNGATQFGTFNVNKTTGVITFTLTADLSTVASPITFTVNASVRNSTTTGDVIQAADTVAGVPQPVTVAPSTFATTLQPIDLRGIFVVPIQGFFNQIQGTGIEDNSIAGTTNPNLFLPNQAKMTDSLVLDPTNSTTAANTNRVINVNVNGPGAGIDLSNIWITTPGDPVNASTKTFAPISSATGYHVTQNASGGFQVTIDDNVNIHSVVIALVLNTPDATGTYGFTTVYQDDSVANQTINMNNQRFQVVQNGGFIPKLTVSPTTQTIYTSTNIGNQNSFLLQGVTATDVQDGDLTSAVQVTSTGGFDPTTPGTYTIGYSVTDSLNNSATGTRTITVVSDQTAVVTRNESIPVGSTWSPADDFVSATDADGNDVALSGITVSGTVDTTTPGTYSVTYSLANHGGATVSSIATITVTGIAPVITTTSLPDGTVGTPYTQLINATGTAPITFAVTIGHLPDGVTLDPSTGALTGTPTTVGVFTFTVTATNAVGNDSQDYTVTVARASSPTTPPASHGGSGSAVNTGGTTTTIPAQSPIAWLILAALGAAALGAGLMRFRLGAKR